MSLRFKLSSIGLVVTFVSTLLIAVTASTANSRWGCREEALYADLVVVAELENYSLEEVPFNNYIPSAPDNGQTYRISVLNLKLIEVIKGDLVGPSLDVVVPGGWVGWPGGIVGESYDYGIGSRWILSLVYWRSMKGGMYMLRYDGGRFFEAGEKWVNKRQQDVSLTLEQLKLILREAEPPVMFEGADVVAEGKVVELTTENSGAREALHVRLHVSASWKGGSPGEDLTVRMADGVRHEDPWANSLREPNVGEDWLFFLKKDESGYFPFAGCNGFLKIDNHELIKSNRVKYPISRRELIESIKKGQRSKR